MEYEVAVRRVPQGYKGGTVKKGEEVINAWLLCSHFHRTSEAARKCGQKELQRLTKSSPEVTIKR